MKRFELKRDQKVFLSKVLIAMGSKKWTTDTYRMFIEDILTDGYYEEGDRLALNAMSSIWYNEIQRIKIK